MTTEATFHALAALVRQRNAIDAELAVIIGRPASTGHVGEWIAAQIFGIDLAHSAAAKPVDGRFLSGPLAGRTVNVKWYLKREGVLDMARADGPDFYLVLTGPESGAFGANGTTRPMAVDGVYLFSGPELEADLRSRGYSVGTGSSVRDALWDAAEIYPRDSARLLLTREQRGLLSLLSSER